MKKSTILVAKQSYKSTLGRFVIDGGKYDCTKLLLYKNLIIHWPVYDTNLAR